MFIINSIKRSHPLSQIEIRAQYRVTGIPGKVKRLSWLFLSPFGFTVSKPVLKSAILERLVKPFSNLQSKQVKYRSVTISSGPLTGPVLNHKREFSLLEKGKVEEAPAGPFPIVFALRYDKSASAYKRPVYGRPSSVEEKSSELDKLATRFSKKLCLFTPAELDPAGALQTPFAPSSPALVQGPTTLGGANLPPIRDARKELWITASPEQFPSRETTSKPFNLVLPTLKWSSEAGSPEFDITLGLDPGEVLPISKRGSIVSSEYAGFFEEYIELSRVLQSFNPDKILKISR